MTPTRHIVRYNNRKLYEPAERRFVTINDLARTVAQGGRVEVLAADTRENITARILSRALASEKAPVNASEDALTRLLQAGSEAAGTVASVMERVGGSQMAASVRKASSPERLAQTLSPVTRRIESARQEVERLVASLVGHGRLTWDEGSRLKEDVGAVLRESITDVVGRIHDIHSRVLPVAPPDVARDIAELRPRLDQLESLVTASFPAFRRDGGNGGAIPRTARAKKPTRNRRKK